MQDNEMIRTVLEECCERQGWVMPIDVIDYCAHVLYDHVNRPDWQPKPSYAEQFMTMRTVKQAMLLGNECWFARAVFPDMMKKRGVNSSYYVAMGTSCFDRVLTANNNPTVRKLRDHFEFTAEVAWTAIHAKGELRSMWE